MEHAGFSSTVTALKGNRWKHRSTDADGKVVEYLWEFGDGAAATGSRATHPYAESGRYLTTLAIRDNAGGEDFESADHAMDISTYDFVGFLGPIVAAPAISEVKAGCAIPMMFSLGGNYGLNIVATGSPTSVQVECPADTAVSAVEPAAMAGAGSLSYDAATD